MPMDDFKFAPKPGQPKPPCPYPCPQRTTTCHSTCSSWLAYEHDLHEFRKTQKNPSDTIYTGSFTHAGITRNRALSKEISRGKLRRG